MEINLFPTKIYHYTSSISTLDLINPILELDKQRDLHYGKDSGGWQGGGGVFESDIFKPIREYILYTIGNTFQREFKISDIWVSILNKGDYNKIHNHPVINPSYYNNEQWAGVFYVKTHNHGGELIIHSPQNPTNTHTIEPKDGDLILFNSNTYHSVTPNQSDEQRICLAFNFNLLDNDA